MCFVALLQCAVSLCLSIPTANCQETNQTRIQNGEDLFSALLEATEASQVSTLVNDHKNLLTESLWQRLIETTGYSPSPPRIFDLALQVSRGLANRRLTAITLYKLGWYEFGQGNIGSAIEKYLQSKSAFEEANSKRDLIYIYADLGTLAIYSSDFEDARAYSLQSLALAEEFKSSTAPSAEWPDEYGIGISLSNLGNISKREARHDDAIELFQKALTAFRKAESNRTKFDSQIIDALADVGRSYLAKGDHIRALTNLNQAMSLAKSSRNLNRVAAIDNSLGILYTNQRDYVKAIDFFNQGIELATLLNDRFKQATLFLNLGVAYQFQKNFGPALSQFGKSLDIAKQIDDKEVQLLVSEGIGVILREQGTYDESLEALEGSLSIARSLGDRNRINEVLWRKAEVYFAKGDFETTVSLASEAWNQANSLNQHNVSYQSATLLGKAYRSLGNNRLAEEIFNKTIDQVERMRQQVAGLETETQLFFEDKIDPYHQLIDLLLTREKTDPLKALGYAEKAKARVLLDVFKNEKIDLTGVLTPREKRQASELNNDIIHLNNRIAEERSQKASNEALLGELKQELAAARLRYESFQNAVYAAHAEPNGFRSGLEFDLSNLNEPKNGKTAFLQYVVLDSKIYLFVVGPSANDQSTKVYSINISREQLAHRVLEYRTMLASQDPGFSDASTALYQLLVLPAESQIYSANTLCIVPDGILWELPFQALQTGANRYLIENVAIYYAPSLTALSEMSRRQIRTGPESLLAFANPRIDNKTFSDLKGVVRGDVLAPLPEAETEVKALKRIWNPNKIFIGPSAEEREFKARASNYRFIHFATHGILDDINPMYSRLLLSRDVNDANDDGLLEAREIMRMNLSAELVVLSACETAQGRVGTGEGMIGMSWAFMMAGVPTVVASQWKVDSATTSELMIKFHRQLKNQYSIRLTGKSQALRQASLALMKVARYKHPFFWAGFVVIGDGG